MAPPHPSGPRPRHPDTPRAAGPLPPRGPPQCPDSAPGAGAQNRGALPPPSGSRASSVPEVPPPARGRRRAGRRERGRGREPARARARAEAPRFSSETNRRPEPLGTSSRRVRRGPPGPTLPSRRPAPPPTPASTRTRTRTRPARAVPSPPRVPGLREPGPARLPPPARPPRLPRSAWHPPRIPVAAAAGAAPPGAVSRGVPGG
ncbi:proline-rich protein 2-like [Perognathus longimembris pacificus]|uniref:proline-rich protein 2-like n=1 Tax=Perognathus longimembris pacificus TaxID=214514 RepID=UPI002019DDCA|nr:proline-rich protein 2-like [Perognathus longimembris pacificus]